MTDVVVHYCTLRIIRRHGWSWGPEPQRLVKRAIGALPGLIARRLGELWPGDSTREIVAPVRITIPIRLDELSSLDPDARMDAIGPGDSGAALLDARIANAIRATLGEDENESDDWVDSETFESQHTDADRDSAPEIYSGSALVRMLLAWLEQGVLEDRLTSFAYSSLDAWHRALFETRTSSPGSSIAATDDAVVRSTNAAAREFAGTPLDGSGLLIRRMIIALKVANELGLSFDDPRLRNKLGLSFDDPRLRNELDRVLPLDTAPPLQPEASAERSEMVPDGKTHVQEPRAPTPAAADRLFAGERHIESALPFLLLGPLSRLGYLDTLAADLEAAGLQSLSPVFASALAYRVLDPPERGWRRTPSAVAAAAAFAALEQPVADPDLARLEQEITDHLSPLDAALSSPLIEGHDKDQPLLLQRADSPGESGFLLLDVDGLFPIGWAGQPANLFPALRKCGGSVLLIPDAIAEPQLLDQLDAEGFSFVTDAPPVRNEQWRAIWRGRNRWWTNDLVTPPSFLMKDAQRLNAAATDAAELWQMLAIERPSVRADRAGAFDRHLTHAAATALGTIAWELWRGRESTAPQLALERFRDLDARVYFSSDSIRVSLSLGRRHLDLREHGMLEDIRHVPWLGGRVVQFSGG